MLFQLVDLSRQRLHLPLQVANILLELHQAVGSVVLGQRVVAEQRNRKQCKEQVTHGASIPRYNPRMSSPSNQYDILRGIGRWDLVALMVNITIGSGILGLPAKLFAPRRRPVEIGFISEKITRVEGQCIGQVLATISASRLKLLLERLDIDPCHRTRRKRDDITSNLDKG